MPLWGPGRCFISAGNASYSCLERKFSIDKLWQICIFFPNSVTLSCWLSWLCVRNYKVNMLVLIHVMNGQSHVSLLVVSELLCILLEPIWSLPDRPSQSDSSAWSGSCGHCSQSVSQTLSGRWCWPQRCLRGAQGQMAHLNRRNVHVQQYIVCLFAFHFVTFCSLFCFVVFANLSPSPLPPADDDSLHRCSAPWSSWPNQRYVTWPWQNAAVSSKRSHYWRKDPLRQRETTQLYTLRDQEAGRLP